MPTATLVCAAARFTCERPSTIRQRHKAVEHVIRTVRERLDEPLSLAELADLACLSPYHFNRVFRQITGLPPFHFVTALRMDAAKRLLLTTTLSVTDVCLEVGYQSLGSFTTHFSRFVGLSPSRFRALCPDSILRPLKLVRAQPYSSIVPEPAPPWEGVSGRVILQENFSGPVFVGLFTTAIPRQRPVACSLLTEPGRYHIPHIPDGQYFVFAAAFEWSRDPLSYLLHSEHNLRVGATRYPVRVINGRSDMPADCVLRPPQLIDPPILITLPLLLSERREYLDRPQA